MPAHMASINLIGALMSNFMLFFSLEVVVLVQKINLIHMQISGSVPDNSTYSISMSIKNIELTISTLK